MKLLKALKLNFLSILLHYANRHTREANFYKAKDKILTKFGNPMGFDVQFIEGKVCYTCNGTGIYKGYHSECGHYQDTCWNCHEGWFKRPVWNILQVFKFGKYTFHRPYERVFYEPIYLPGQKINGYITHNRIRFGELAVFIFCLLYEKGYLKRYYEQSGVWYSKWWRIENWLSSIIHLIKYKGNSVPFRKVRYSISEMFKKPVIYSWGDDDLPF
ncbi:MAG: hypothetical protein ABJH04_08110 [Cyclobacteriaceae bacterium]